MGTKYAQARDTAYQWRSELRKVSREIKSLRKVYDAARALTRKIAAGADHTEALMDLREALDRAVFAVYPSHPSPAPDQGETP
jgi:hypothetical protein